MAYKEKWSKCRKCGRSEKSVQLICDNCGAKGKELADSYRSDIETGWAYMYFGVGETSESFNLCKPCIALVLAAFPKLDAKVGLH